MERESGWIPLTAGTVLCTLASFLLTVLIAQGGNIGVNPAAGKGQADALLVLRLMK